jgi:hypothetical protein
MKPAVHSLLVQAPRAWLGMPFALQLESPGIVHSAKAA